MKKRAFLSVFIFLMLIFLSVNGCKDKPEFEEEIEPTILTNIEITSPPAKTKYKIGEIIDLAGLQVNYLYSDGSKEQTENYSVSGNTFTSGVSSITVFADNDSSKAASFEITVSNELVDTGLPVIYIETENASAITSKENYVNMNLKITTDNPEHCLEKTGFTDRIRGRGNTS